MKAVLQLLRHSYFATQSEGNMHRILDGRTSTLTSVQWQILGLAGGSGCYYSYFGRAMQEYVYIPGYK